MPHYTEYKCGVCNRVTERDLLVVKKAVFSQMGAGGKVLRSRTIEWKCDECLEKDTEWNTLPYTNAPGQKSAPLERVRAAEARDSDGN